MVRGSRVFTLEIAALTKGRGEESYDTERYSEMEVEASEESF
jgi:hypothetical protein